MTGKTHKAGGVLCALVGVQVINSYTNLSNEISPLIQFCITYPFCMWGSTAPDLDHDWSNVEDKNPINYAINKVLHFFNELYEKAEMVGQEKHLKLFKALSARHRSWQTHSDLTLLLLFVLRYLLIDKFLAGFTSSVDVDILILIINGLLLGTGVHLFLDMLTRAGIKSLILTVVKKVVVSLANGKWKDVKPVKIRLVPNREFFGTDSNGTYESTVRKVIQTTTYIYAVLWLVYRYTNFSLPFITRG